MNIRHYIVATAGHVDHGKSSLVHALTGTDPDRLPEEKARGITIDVGFAFLDLPSPPNATPAIYRIGIVDVPGHENFIRNMVAGVGSIDAALLVVAADDAWMPQTEEHLQILSYLGLQRGVVALTKSDLAGSAISRIQTGVRACLQNSPLADAPIIPVSALTGQGLDRLREALAHVLADLPPQPDLGKPRLAVDRAFTLKGIGTVVTGTLSGGALSRGQRIIVQPAGLPARIRSLQSHHHELDHASPGQRLAINLPDLRPRAAQRGGNSIGRGDVVTIDRLGSPTRTLDILLHCTPRLSTTGPATILLRNGAQIQVHHGATSTSARIRFLDCDGLSAGASAVARLRLDSPLLALCGDRLVIRSAAARRTLAGGIVLDPDPRLPLRRDQTRAFLTARAASPYSAETLATSQLARDHWISPSALHSRSVLPEAEIQFACRTLAARGLALCLGDHLVETQHWHQVLSLASRAVDDWHSRFPEQLGIPLDQLRQSLARSLANCAPFDTLLQSLTSDGFTQTGAILRRAEHHPRLPPRLQAAGQRLRAELSAHPFDPPARQQLARDDLSRQAMKFLLASGEAVELSPDLVLSTDALARAANAITAWIRQHGPATVSQLKTTVNTSRRVMVPLLEKLDAQGITRRAGDQRTLPS